MVTCNLENKIVEALKEQGVVIMTDDEAYKVGSQIKIYLDENNT